MALGYLLIGSSIGLIASIIEVTLLDASLLRAVVVYLITSTMGFLGAAAMFYVRRRQVDLTQWLSKTAATSAIDGAGQRVFTAHAPQGRNN